MYWKFTKQVEELCKAGSEVSVSSYTLHTVWVKGLGPRLDWEGEGYTYKEAGRRLFCYSRQDAREKNEK